MTAMPATAAEIAVARKTAKTAFIMLVVSLLCHMVLVPIAAWNHSLVLVIVSALIPMVIINVLRKQGKFPAYKSDTKTHAKSILTLVVRTTVTAFLFWNHLWLIAVVAMIVMSFVKAKSAKEAHKAKG